MVVKTVFHKFSITCAGSPLTGVPNASEAGSQYLKVIDFNDRNDGDYSCPYVDKFPARDVPTTLQRYANHTPGDDWVEGQYRMNLPTANPGELAIYLNTPLVITGNATDPICSDTVELLIFERIVDGQLFDPIDPTMGMYFPPDWDVPALNQFTKKVPAVQTLSGPIETEVLPAESPLLDFGKVHTVAPQLNSVEGQDDICTMINRFTVPFGIQLSNHLYVVPLCPRMFSRVTHIGVTDAAVSTPAWTWALTHVYRYFTSSFDFLIHNPSTDSFVVVGFMPNRGVIGRGLLS